MADNAHTWTDEKLIKMEKRLSAIYSRAQKEIGQEWSEYVASVGREVKAYEDALNDAIKSGDKKSIAAAKRKLQRTKKNATIQNKRFKDLSEEVAKQLANVNKTALAYINGELPEIYSVNYNHLASAVDGVDGYAFSLLDPDTVRNLATTDTSLLPYKQIDPAKDIPWNMKKINSETLQGILQGESMDQIADRLKNVQQMNEVQAIRSARTIVTGAENKGRQDSYYRATEDGIIMGKEWIATRDSRTRHWHRELDGVVVDAASSWENDFGEIMFPGDPSADPANVYNCRCTMGAVVLGFKKVR